MTALLSLFLLFLLHSLVTVSSQLMVQAMVGQAVLLPCVTRSTRLSKDVSVFWRGRDNSNVLDIRKNQEDLSNQNKTFTGRVFSQSELYRTGNFSILMTEVRKSDEGPYECSIPQIGFKQRVTLTVSARRVEEVTEAAGPASGGGSAVTLNSLRMLPLLLSVVSTGFT